MSKQVIIGVCGIPVNSKNKVLLTKRHAPGKVQWHNKWQFAGGGLDHGETTEECLMREMWEELRVKPTILHPHPIAKTSIWYADENKTKMEAHVLLLSYLVDIGDQEPDLTQDPDWETSDWGWYTLKEAKKLDCLPLTLPTVEDAYEIIDRNDILTTKE